MTPPPSQPAPPLPQHPHLRMSYPLASNKPTEVDRFVGIRIESRRYPDPVVGLTGKFVTEDEH